MAPRLFPWREDPIRPAEPEPLKITVDGNAVNGVCGQSIAGVLLADDRVGFRTTSAAGAPRGVFCGIGVCFDCLVEVNGMRDVRACQRRAHEGDVVVSQHDPLPVPAEQQHCGSLSAEVTGEVQT
jgi:predicted molibdopterin-dependent oxidoreductase YjgC